MEHKWGRTIFEGGLIGVGCTLAARIPTVAQDVWVTNARSPPGFFTMWNHVLNSAVPYTWSFVGKIAGHPHFPYGYPVEPDAPV